MKLSYAKTAYAREGVEMATAIDPVCGMEVDTDNPPGGSYEYEDVIYYFCAPGCREDFAEDPPAYLRQ